MVISVNSPVVCCSKLSFLDKTDKKKKLLALKLNNNLKTLIHLPVILGIINGYGGVRDSKIKIISFRARVVMNWQSYNYNLN